jgi:UDP-3-O-[3-hydroxymyristoyl] N-acetylglucosamine deacetylase
VSVVLEGRGLHSGVPARVTFARGEGRTRLRRAGEECALDALRVVDTLRSTTVARSDGHVRVGMVEHLFAALAAIGARRGLLIDVEGPELPLLDGGSLAYFDAVRSLDLASSPPDLAIAKVGTVAVGGSAYRFEPGPYVEIEVTVDWGDERLGRSAEWNGDADLFRGALAEARTFGFEDEVSELLERGLANHVARESVVVVGADTIHCAGRPFSTDEPARHKLLDLIGDLFLHGGPPLGRVHASRPGHAATHAAIARAMDLGILVVQR